MKRPRWLPMAVAGSDSNGASQRTVWVGVVRVTRRRWAPSRRSSPTVCGTNAGTASRPTVYTKPPVHGVLPTATHQGDCAVTQPATSTALRTLFWSSKSSAE
ncbi:hypothetical protein [Hydrogenophaga soli]